jgi:abortive infection bacteriophage resistance protein
MKLSYDRPWKSFEEQLALLKNRALVVTNDVAALRYLERIGYYRLSAYLHTFRQFEMALEGNRLISRQLDTFVPNTHFLDAVNLYWFDRRLRLVLMDALERIEIAVRVDIAYLLGQRGPLVHHEISQFHPSFAKKKNRHTGMLAFDQWHEKYGSLINRSKEDFVKHYRRSHGEQLPIWVAVEVWDFGAMSQLFSMMKANDQTAISSKYGVQDFKVFASWLRSLNYLRNLVAHHSRVWNRNVIDQPRLPKKGEISWCDDFIGNNDLIAKPFILMSICNHLMNIINKDSCWNKRLSSLFSEFPDIQSDRKPRVDDMGMPEGWLKWWNDRQ